MGPAGSATATSSATSKTEEEEEELEVELLFSFVHHLAELVVVLEEAAASLDPDDGMPAMAQPTEEKEEAEPWLLLLRVTPLPARTAPTLTGTRAAKAAADFEFAAAAFVFFVVVHRAPRWSVASETAGCALKAPGESSEGAASSAVMEEVELEEERDWRSASGEIEEEEEQANGASLLPLFSSAKSAKQVMCVL